MQTIIGIIIGWVLTQLSQWYKGRKEDNRIRKQVLYYLLEIRNTLPKLNVNSNIKKSKDYIEGQFPILFVLNKYKAQLEHIITTLATTVLQDLQSDLNSINERFEESIKKLSLVNPVLAYKLSGNLKVLSIGGYLEQYAETIQKNLEVSIEQIEHIKKYYKDFTDESLQELERDFDYYCRNLSIKVGILTWFSTRKVLRNIGNIDIKTEEGLNEKIESFLSMFDVDLNQFRRINAQFISMSEAEKQQMIDEINKTQ